MVRGRRFDVDDKIPEDALEQERVRRAERKSPNERGLDDLERSMGSTPSINDIMSKGNRFSGSRGLTGRDFGRPDIMGGRGGLPPMHGRGGMPNTPFGAGGMSDMNRPVQQQSQQAPKSVTEQIFDKSLVLGAQGSKKAIDVLKELYPLMKTMGTNTKLRKSFLATLFTLYGCFGALGFAFVLLGWNAGGFFLTMLFCGAISFLSWIVDNMVTPREEVQPIVEEKEEVPQFDSRFEAPTRSNFKRYPETLSDDVLDEPDLDELEDLADLDDLEDLDNFEDLVDLEVDDDIKADDLDLDDFDIDDDDLDIGSLLTKATTPEMTHGFIDGEDSVEASEEKINSVTDKFEVIDNNLVNRGLLFDSFIDMLDGGTAVFDKEIVHDVDSEIALKYSTLLHEAQDAAGQKEDNYVEIQSFKERLMVFDLVVSRKNLSKANIDVFNEELTALISTKDDGSRNKGIYSKMVLAGRKIYITIFKGENHLVYLRDILVKNREFFTNPKHKIPVCLGYDEKGSAVLTDLYDVESIICCGKPRTGKSVSVKVIVSQMVQFCSPKEVQFYMGDVKEGTSDWAPLQVPHVKRFEATPEGLLNILNYIIEVEAPRRSELIGNAGSIKAYNKVNVDNKLPFIYIVFDELVALSSASEDAIRKDFHKALKRAITQFPNLGIRLILIPHTIRHDIIDKLASDNIDFKMAVKADNDTVKEVFKLKNIKDFQYSLEQIGEFAVKLPNSTEVRYAHAPVLMSDDLRIPLLFDTQRKIWSSVCPDEVESSAYNKGVEKKRQTDILEKTNLTDKVFEEPDWIAGIAGRR